MADQTDPPETHASVVAALATNAVETLAMGIAAWFTGSLALRAQTAANAADVAVSIFLYIGVVSSVRPPNDFHPLGYGRERFFWSLFAAIGIFVGGGGFAIDEAVRSFQHPTQIDSYPIAYLVLAGTVVLDAFALSFAWRPLAKRARERGVPVPALLRYNTDPALTTVAVGGCSAVIGGVIAAMGLAVSQVTGSPMADTAASGLIGLLLLITSVFLLNTNRQLLTGRGISPNMLREIRKTIAMEKGVVHVRDVFAVVVGPASLIVNGDITFVDEMDVPAVEQAIKNLSDSLRERWPEIEFVYLTPVSQPRPRRVKRSR